MPGYDMYQGGVNPDGKLTSLNEEHPNQLPVKDYDFQAPLGAAGEVREQYHLLREQHLFLQDYGSLVARMSSYFPERRPASLKDFDTLRWDMRSDGRSGFLFYSNEQPYEPLPEHKAVQFEVKTRAGSLLIPHQSITIPSGGYGIWPVNLDCSGLTLEYATAQPLTRISANRVTIYFFTALPGVEPEFLFSSGNVTAPAGTAVDWKGKVLVHQIKPGTTPAALIERPDGTRLSFVVLTPEQGRRFWRVSFAGQDRAILSNAAVLVDGSVLRLQGADAGDQALEMFPPVGAIRIGSQTVKGVMDGIFARYAYAEVFRPRPIKIAITQEKPAGANTAALKGAEEETWNDAATYKLDIPGEASSGRALIHVKYIGDAARLYVGDRLVNDNFYNGDPFSIALWRIPFNDWSKIRLKVLPYSEALERRLPAAARANVSKAKVSYSLDQVTVEAETLVELRCVPL
jgi:beta-galactosidase